MDVGAGDPHKFPSLHWITTPNLTYLIQTVGTYIGNRKCEGVPKAHACFFSRERYGDITALLRLYGCVAATEWPECGDGFTAHGKTAVIEKKVSQIRLLRMLR